MHIHMYYIVYMYAISMLRLLSLINVNYLYILNNYV